MKKVLFDCNLIVNYYGKIIKEILEKYLIAEFGKFDNYHKIERKKIIGIHFSI